MDSVAHHSLSRCLWADVTRIDGGHFAEILEDQRHCLDVSSPHPVGTVRLLVWCVPTEGAVGRSCADLVGSLRHDSRHGKVMEEVAVVKQERRPKDQVGCLAEGAREGVGERPADVVVVTAFAVAHRSDGGGV